MRIASLSTFSHNQDPEQTFDRLPTQVRAALNPWIQGEELVRKACATEAIRPLGKVGWSQRQQ
jgi:hypothetical protein